MDARLSPEQETLANSVAQVVDHLGPKTVAQFNDTERVGKLDTAVDSSGWRELRAPDVDGFPWASAVDVAVVAEELARGLADAAFTGPTLAAELRRLAGVEGPIARETVALTPDLTGPGTSVAVDVAGASSALTVDAGDVLELRIGKGLPNVDLTRRSASVERAGPTIGKLPEGSQDRWVALGLAVTCADLVGTMRGAIELARSYATERRQYGVPVGSFQAIQHLLADAFVAAEGARSIALHAAWAVDALPPASAVAAGAAAKAYCARAARTVCETVIQVHGGIGHTWECLAHAYLRRALLSADLLGGVGPSLARVLAHHGVGGGHGLR